MREALGYYRALNELEKLVAANTRVTETVVQRLHAVVMGARRGSKKSPYRDGQNVIATVEAERSSTFRRKPQMFPL